MNFSSGRARRWDLSSYPTTAPTRRVRLLFLHHSCGGQLLADPGPELGENCIYRSHPNGGGLRGLLERNSYEVHEASYGSRIGNRTDLFDWLPKFRDQMEEVLRCDAQDLAYRDERRNEVVLFKSCFPNSQFVAEGTPPGNPAGPPLTVWNAKATYSALLSEFRRQPGTLFLCVTAPPLASGSDSPPLWKRLARRILGRGGSARSGLLARAFNNWLAGEDGWLKDYSLRNVAVFDYYDVLTEEGKSNFSAYPTGNGLDSHPSRQGNQTAAAALVPLLNRALHQFELRSKLVDSKGKLSL